MSGLMEEVLLLGLAESGQMKVTIEGQEPFIASKHFLIQVPKRLQYSMEVVGNEPALRFDALRLNGAYQQETVVSSPAFFPTVSLPAPGTGSARAAVHRVAADVQMPFDFLGEFSYERRLPHGLLATVSVNVDKGTHQLRSRNTAGPGAAVPVFQVESTGRMLQRALTLAARPFGPPKGPATRPKPSSVYFRPPRPTNFTATCDRSGGATRYLCV